MKTDVVIVPGIMGSELICSKAFSYQKFRFKKGELVFLGQDPFKPSLEALICNSNGASVYPIQAREATGGDSHFGVLGLYTQIAEALKGDRRIGKVFFFSYDWRLSLWELSERLERFIEEKSLEKVTLVAHSLGGLLASRFIAGHPAMVERFISLCTPFCGAPAALYALETGHYFGGWKSFLNLPVSGAFKKIAKTFESVYSLLPTQDYIEGLGYISEHKSGASDAMSYSRLFNRGASGHHYIKKNANEVAEFLGRRPWMNSELWESAQRFQRQLYAGGAHAAFTADSYFLIGYGKETVARLEYLNRFGFHYFDRPIMNNEGDGLVPLQSATLLGQLPRDRTFYFNDEHNGMLNDAGVIALICGIAAGAEGRELGKSAAVSLLEMENWLRKERVRPGPLFKRASNLRNKMRFSLKKDSAELKPDFSLNGGWQRSDVRVKLFEADNRPDLWKIEYRLNDGPIRLYSAPITVSGEGVNRIAAVAYDKEGNISSPVIIEVKIDKTTPEIIVDPLPRTAQKGSVIKVTYSASDSLSGVESVTGTFNGRPFESGETLMIEKSGANIIKITAFDNAGNRSIKPIAIMAKKGL